MARALSEGRRSLRVGTGFLATQRRERTGASSLGAAGLGESVWGTAADAAGPSPHGR